MPGDSTTYVPTARTRVRRLSPRGSYDRALVHAILDEALGARGSCTKDSVVCNGIRAVGELL